MVAQHWERAAHSMSRLLYHNYKAGVKGKPRENVIGAQKERHRRKAENSLEVDLHMCQLFLNKSDEEIQWEREIFPTSVAAMLQGPYGEK